MKKLPENIESYNDVKIMKKYKEIFLDEEQVYFRNFDYRCVNAIIVAIEEIFIKYNNPENFLFLKDNNVYTYKVIQIKITDELANKNIDASAINDLISYFRKNAYDEFATILFESLRQIKKLNNKEERFDLIYKNIIARMDFSEECESALNELITNFKNKEYSGIKYLKNTNEMVVSYFKNIPDFFITHEKDENFQKSKNHFCFLNVQMIFLKIIEKVVRYNNKIYLNAKYKNASISDTFDFEIIGGNYKEKFEASIIIKSTMSKNFNICFDKSTLIDNLIYFKNEILGANKDGFEEYCLNKISGNEKKVLSLIIEEINEPINKKRI